MTGRLQQRLTWLQASGRVPGVVAGVLRDGELVWAGAVGGDVEASYRIGSITKTFTAVLVLQLRDEGLLDLDDPVGRVVPEAGGYADRTLRDLLGHTAGLQSEPGGSWWERSPGVDITTLLAANDGAGAVHGGGRDPEGGWHHYSNLSYALLGETAARLRGSSWRTCVEERLVVPLGLARTTYLPDERSATGRSVGHHTGTLTAEPATDTGAMAPAGQLWSTVGDLALWARFLVEGHPDVLAEATLREMSLPRPGSSHGLGLHRLEQGGRTLVGHTGSMPGFQASLFVDRATGEGSIALASSTTGLDAGAVPEVLLGEDDPPAVEAWVPTVAVPAAVADLLGVWFWGNTAYDVRWHADADASGAGGSLHVVHLQSARLSHVFSLEGPGSTRLVGTSGHHRGETLHVVRRGDGTPHFLQCATFVYTRVPYDPTTPIPGGAPWG